MINLFDKIQEKNYDEVITYIKQNPEIELNIQDKFNNYLIEYILNTNNIKLIKFVLLKDIMLDFVDNNGTTLLYNIIKFNKIEILELLIKSNEQQIGINILDKKDIRGRTSLHYCVIFNNFDAFKIILDNRGDPFIPNKNGENIFFYSLRYKRDNILTYIFTKYSNFNIVNRQGENLLQVSINYSNYEIVDYLLDKTTININNQSKEYGTTALQQLIVNNKDNYVYRLIKMGADITTSDFLGNNVIHFSIMEDNTNLILYFLDLNKINCDLTNLDGNTPLHLYLINGNKLNSEILKILIEKTNLNIQNHEGNTCLHLLANKGILNDFNDIIINKELNIFIQNYKGNTVYNLYKDDKELIDIVTKSYFNNLSNSNLIIDWEIKCSLIKDNKVNEFKIKTNEKKLGKIKTKEDCIDKIKKVILEENRSVPKIKEINFDLNSGIIVKDCFFSGFPIDTLFGILWLKKNYPNIGLILDYPLASNENIAGFYEKMGIGFNYKLDFINTMIIWSYQKIFFPEYFDTIINKKINDKTKVIVIPIGIETPQGAHTNIIFWNVEKNIVERFEPNGKNPPINFDYNPNLLDTILIQKFKKFNSKIEYLKPSDYLPTIGFQIIENLENDRCKKIGDPNGFCTVWCIWYCYQKLLNINIPSDVLVNELINNIKLEGKSFKNLIRNFSKNISEYRDTFLKKVNLNIDDWILSNYGEEELDKLEKLIISIL
tara:strand:- start:453 stop:2603 length:2151 start_codon:yes stop_codon:yes gene_type:complete